MSVAIEKRWPGVIPDVDPTKFAALKALCDAVRWAPASWHDELERLHDSTERDRVLEEMIAKKFPFLTLEARRDTCSYARFVNR